MNIAPKTSNEHSVNRQSCYIFYSYVFL